MAALLDPKHEQFAIHLASGNCNQSEAARLAGFAVNSSYNTGARLAKRPEIIARIGELREAEETYRTKVVKTPVDKFTGRHWIVQKTVTLQHIARQSSQLSVSYNCLRLLAQIGGLLEPKQPKGPTTLTQNNFNTMTPKQLRDMLAETVKDLPAAQRQQLLQSADVSDVIDITAADAVDVDSLLG
jgi:hypothetical protein